LRHAHVMEEFAKVTMGLIHVNWFSDTSMRLVVHRVVDSWTHVH